MLMAMELDQDREMKIPQGEEDPDGGISEISPYISRPVIGQHTGMPGKVAGSKGDKGTSLP